MPLLVGLIETSQSRSSLLRRAFSFYATLTPRIPSVDQGSVVVAEPVAVTGELAELAEQLDHRGIRLLREVLGRPFSHGPTDVTDAEAARLTETYRTFLDIIGDGVTLTAAGYLPPAVVEQVAESTGISEWWIGKANREDLTYPVADDPHHGARPRAGQRPQGPPEPDRRSHPMWP